MARPSVPSPSYINADRPFHSWIQNSVWETTSNTPRVVPAWWERHSQPAEHHVWTFAHRPAAPNLSNRGNYDTWIFTFFFFTFPPTFFSLENLKKFQQRVIQYSSFSGLTFSDWQRGSSRFIWKTLLENIFRGAIFPNGVVRFFFCVWKEGQVKGQVSTCPLR